MIEKLMKELEKDNHELTDINFFLGDNRNITQKQLVDEVIKGLTQVRLGDTQKVKCVDNITNKSTVEQFLQSKQND